MRCKIRMHGETVLLRINWTLFGVVGLNGVLSLALSSTIHSSIDTH